MGNGENGVNIPALEFAGLVRTRPAERRLGFPGQALQLSCSTGLHLVVSGPRPVREKGFFLALDDGLVTVGFGGLPVAVRAVAVGQRGAAVPLAGHAVRSIGMPAERGRFPVSAELRQHLPDELPVIRVPDPVGFSPFRLCLPVLPPGVIISGRHLPGALGGCLVPQLSVPQRVMHPLFPGLAVPVGRVSLLAAVSSLVVALIGAAVAAERQAVTLVSGIIADPAGPSPVLRAAAPRPDGTTVSSGGPRFVAQQHRRSQRRSAKITVRAARGQLFQQGGDRCRLIVVGHRRSW